MRGRVQGVRSTDDGAAWQYLVRLSLFIACHGSVCSRSQTLFGNAVRETPFRASLPGVGSRRETEFREMGSQTEFGNQRKPSFPPVMPPLDPAPTAASPAGHRGTIPAV